MIISFILSLFMGGVIFHSSSVVSTIKSDPELGLYTEYEYHVEYIFQDCDYDTLNFIQEDSLKKETK